MKRSHIVSALAASTLFMILKAPAIAQTAAGGSHSARPQITEKIDPGRLVTLKAHVRADLTPDRDVGEVEDSAPIRLYLLLQRTPEQQAALDNLIARQQQTGAAEYHKWLTPQQFGERFGVAQADIQQITTWLESQGFQVNSVLNNGTMIDFAGNAGAVRNTFQTQLHYWNVLGGKYIANAQDPSVPAELAKVVIGIKGLAKIPSASKHTPVHSFSHDSQTNRWHNLDGAAVSGSDWKYTDGMGSYLLTPQDFYTIYDANKIYAGGNLGVGGTISLPEPTDMNYGTVDPTTGQATGGDVSTFRSIFGIAGTLNMTVMHGAGTVTCNDPGITDAEGEANLDAEWANAVAPSAHLIFMSCDNSNSIGDGFTTALAALIDNNISDVISSSFGSSESVVTAADFAQDNMLISQAATQGQSFVDAAGDSGSADADQNTSTTAVKGLNVDQFAGHPLVTAVGGTDFSDKYDADQGGQPQSTYWSAASSQYYADALSYIPETPWNNSCANSIIAKDNGGLTREGYCATLGSGATGTIVGGGGGFSAHYSQPAYQPGTPGLSSTATNRATPDIAFFAASGFWGHYLVVCDSSTASTACTPPITTFGGAGGTSFTAPQTAGVVALLVTATGQRQGTLNPALYALAKAQYAASATATACYSNGQTNNIGVTIGLPAPACTFHDITTGNNDEACQAGSLDCFVNAGAQYGMLSVTGANSLTVAFPAGPGYDEATGLGSLDIYNLITNWNQANSSRTSVSANPNSITPAQSTTLTATVTGGTPTGFAGPAPKLTGSVDFYAGTTCVGTCTLSDGTCSLKVNGCMLQKGSNSITATFKGSGTYPASTSCVETVIVTSTQMITFGALPNVTYGVNPITLNAWASSGLPVAYTVTGPATVSGSFLTVTGAGRVTVTASQPGNSDYSAATPVSQSFLVSKALLTVTANNQLRTYGAANPVFTYAITGFVNADTSVVVSGTASETTTATSTSPAGNYPIAFSTENLTAGNYTFRYLDGTLAVTNFTIKTSRTTKCHRGDFAKFILELSSVNGFDANVTLTCSGGPAGAKCPDFPETLKVDGTAYEVSGTLFPKDTPPGTYVITFTSTSGMLTNTTSANFIVK